MNKLVMCISGGIGSGKTSLASVLADRMQVAHASFGRFVRGVAATRGMPDARREYLQDLGTELINVMGWDAFCRETLGEGGWTPGAGAIVEGIRHEKAFLTVAEIVAPVPCVLLFIEADFALRQQRLESRGSSDAADLARAEAHSTEEDVRDRLRGRAELVLDGSRDLASSVHDVMIQFPDAFA